MLKPSRLHVWRRLIRIFPETRMFDAKAALLRWAGGNIGRNVRICSSSVILGNASLSIGDDVWIGSQTFISVFADVFIGSHVDIAPRVHIVTGSHEIDAEGAHTAGKGKSMPVCIEDGVWLGANALILPGVTIGEKAVVAAGAVVTRDVSARTIVAGVPARQVKSI